MSDSQITKKALAQALKDLMEEKPFSKISVGNICALCNMNRKSFYYHFKDKYDLLHWIFDTEFIEALRSEHTTSDGWEILERICEYFYENRSFYINAFEMEGQDSFQDYLGEIIGMFIERYFPTMVEEGKNSEFFRKIFTDLFLQSIESWLRDEQDWPPHEFVSSFRGFLNYSANRLIEFEEKKEIPKTRQG